MHPKTYIAEWGWETFELGDGRGVLVVRGEDGGVVGWFEHDEPIDDKTNIRSVVSEIESVLDMDSIWAERRGSTILFSATYDPIALARDAAELAAAKARERGVDKDTWLPYVRAASTYWAKIQERALAEDNTRASFEALSEQLAFAAEFEALTGRNFDLLRDEITYEEIKSV